MDELIIKMMQNRGCERLEKGFQVCWLILGVIALLLSTNLFIEEICYDDSFWKTIENILVIFIILLILIKKLIKYNNLTVMSGHHNYSNISPQFGQQCSPVPINGRA